MDQPFRTNAINSLAFFQSEPHMCSYLPAQLSTSLFADPSFKMTNSVYSQLINFGFRRSGSLLYSPNCRYCDACQSVRIPVNKFKPNRSQRRALKINADLEVTENLASFKQEHYELYRRYIHDRHTGSTMENPTTDDYMGFLDCDWSETYFYEIRDAHKLIAVTVADKISNGLSAVYTFYDADAAHRSLGKFAILYLISETLEKGLDWFYLGYWIDQCPKMKYKIEYQPTEIFTNGRWKNYPPR